MRWLRLGPVLAHSDKRLPDDRRPVFSGDRFPARRSVVWRCVLRWRHALGDDGARRASRPQEDRTAGSGALRFGDFRRRVGFRSVRLHQEYADSFLGPFQVLTPDLPQDKQREFLERPIGELGLAVVNSSLTAGSIQEVAGDLASNFSNQI